MNKKAVILLIVGFLLGFILTRPRNKPSVATYKYRAEAYGQENEKLRDQLDACHSLLQSNTKAISIMNDMLSVSGSVPQYVLDEDIEAIDNSTAKLKRLTDDLDSMTGEVSLLAEKCYNE